MSAEAATSKVAAGFAVVYVVWGSTFLALKFALATVPPFLLAGLRNTIAGGLLLAWAAAAGAARPTSVQWRRAAVAGALFFLGNQGGIAWAQQRVPSGLASVLVATVPLWLVAFEAMRGTRRPSTQALTGLIVGFAGSGLLVARTGFGEWTGGDATGTLILTACAASWALGTLYSRGAALPDSVPLATSMAMLTGGSLLLAASALSGEMARVRWAAFTPTAIGALAYLVFAGSLLGFSTYMWLLRVAPASRVATYAYVNPVIALFLGWWLGGEALATSTLVAVAVSLFGVFLVVTARSEAIESSRKGAPATSTPGREPGDDVLSPGTRATWMQRARRAFTPAFNSARRRQSGRR